MAGIASISAMQFVDLNGRPQAGAKAYFYAGGTLDPLTVFSEAGLGTELSNPVTADAYGRFPMIFLDEADEFYSFRVTTSGGSTIAIPSANSSIPIVGPSGGGGGSEVPVDPNALFQTGDVKPRLGTGVHSGWVRVNGRTIGSATSGATERANADTQALFEHLWSNFSNTLCAVSGGRGLSASADWSANKTITLPDAKGRGLIGADTMGSGSAASRITVASIVTGDADTIGSSGGVETVTLATADIPSHKHSITDSGHQHTVQNNNASYAFAPSASGGGANTFQTVASTVANIGTAVSNVTGITETNNIGGGGAHNNMPPYMVVTLYVRL